jgi:hypothetical protein
MLGGTKNEGFSFSQRMNFAHNYDGTLIPNPSMRLVVNILPERMTRVKQPKKTKARSNSYASAQYPHRPFLFVNTNILFHLTEIKKKKDDIPDENEELCSAVSILTLSERDALEKRGNELLASVDSWKSLDGPCSQEWGIQGTICCCLFHIISKFGRLENNLPLPFFSFP